MKKEFFKELNINYYKKYEKEKEIIKNNYEKVVNLIEKLWDIDSKRPTINIYIFISDFKYILCASNWFFIILRFTILLPHWLLRGRKRWKKWRGVSGFQKKEPSILIKPMEHYNYYTNKNFFKYTNLYLDNKKEKIFKSTFCHEIFQVYTHDLKLPAWLKQGLAIITEEYFLDKKMILSKSINLLKEKHLDELDEKYSTYILIKGYWTVRYLEEKYPDFLKKTIKKYREEEIVKEIGKKLGLNINNKDELWEQIDDLLYDHYQYLLEE